jgi:hypothetical protein
MQIVTGREYTSRWYTPQFHIEDKRKLVAVEEKSGEMPDGSAGTWTILILEDGTRKSTGRYTGGGKSGLYYPVKRVHPELPKLIDWDLVPIEAPLKV